MKKNKFHYKYKRTLNKVIKFNHYHNKKLISIKLATNKKGTLLNVKVPFFD